ncbi:hypothetical protein B0J13DRAFT_247167 [Dactylonectria estremocensis]|uniref:Smr domain-containing protein n=1 Tax=Dactylonectria estremocensis TaxID=1079267 RepID=A0A9P9J9R5_9HYPO|nr:hypothetical protein B0J13DRAFT_247167 [Dactylonectria estremocensis]
MPNETSEAAVQKLVDLFRTLLDEALIVAIASDHDLKQRSGYKAAQSTLENIARDVTVEEATGFNSSGFSASPAGSEGGGSNTETTISLHGCRIRDTDTSSSDLASTTGSAYSIPRLTTFNNDSEESKILQLQGMFNELTEHDIKSSLEKAGGDFQGALDDLLDIQYLKSTGQYEDAVEVDKKRRKGKKNKKKKAKSPLSDMHVGTECASSDSSNETYFNDVDSNEVDSKEMQRQDEIAYLADRLNLPFDDVSATYNRKRFSSSATAVEIIAQHITLGIEAQDDASKKEAQALAQKYRNVPENYMSTVVQVTGSIPQWSDDIARLLSKHFTKKPWKQKLDLNYTLAPLPREDLEGLETGQASVSRIAKSSAPKRADPMAYTQATEKAGYHYQAKREATASALQLSKRGASNPLYRQAAGYYAEVAREQGRSARQAWSTAADLLVEQQSNSSSIDLHGVHVQDGVRIARQKVQAWWAGLGEFRTGKARQQRFTVITGLGRHSAGGVSQLRQAVAAALLEDGWKMQVETGRFVVEGRR